MGGLGDNDRWNAKLEICPAHLESPLTNRPGLPKAAKGLTREASHGKDPPNWSLMLHISSMCHGTFLAIAVAAGGCCCEFFLQLLLPIFSHDVCTKLLHAQVHIALSKLAGHSSPTCSQGIRKLSLEVSLI